MDITVCVDPNCWEDFIKENSHASFYHRFAWKQVIEETLGLKTFYLAAEEDGCIQGVLPLVLCSTAFFGRILVSMPFLNYGGICIATRQAKQQLLEKAKEITVSEGARYLELRHTHRVDENLPVKTHKVSMTITLEACSGKMWEKLGSKMRGLVRKAEKSGLVVQQGRKELLDTFYQVFSRGMRDMGTPVHQKSFFNSILRLMADSIKIFVVYYQGQPVGVAINGYFKDTVEGLWAAALRKQYPKLLINYALYWEMIRDACDSGYRFYHLGRSSKDSGAFHFKKKWLAQPKQLYWEYFLNRVSELPGLSVDNPKYQLPMKIWRRLPLKIANTIGPLLARGIP